MNRNKTQLSKMLSSYKRFNWFFWITLTLIIMAQITIVVCTIYLVKDPEAIGAFFGKIFNGFNLAK
jgi:hypothetical protein